jgi:RNA polymerase sigma-70 factor (ECF subfamily)
MSSSHSEVGDSTSATLLERVHRRDPDAWRRFSALYGPLVYRWSIREKLQPQDAADVTQDVFRTLAEHPDGFQRRSPSDSFRGWLWTVTRNKIRDHYRRGLRVPSAVGGTSAQRQIQETPALSEASDDTPASVRAELAHRAVRLMQGDFEPKTWQAFWAVVVDGRSTVEAARELGLTVAAVYKAKSRVLMRLRRELDGLLE